MTQVDPVVFEVLRNPGAILARCYGVKADGVTDDRAALQAAINAAEAAGGVVQLPAGTIRLGSASAEPDIFDGLNGGNAEAGCILLRSTSLIGAGVGRTILKKDASLNTAVIYPVDADNVVI